MASPFGTGETLMRLLALIGLLLCTSGCVAAAIPVIAGATIAKKQNDGTKTEGSRQADASAPPKEVRKAVFVGEEAPKASLAPTPVTEAVEVPAKAAPARLYTVTDGPVTPSPAPEATTTSVTKGKLVATPAPAPVTLPASALAPAASPAPARPRKRAETPPAAASAPTPAPAPVAAIPPKGQPGKGMSMPPAPIPVSGKSTGYLGFTAYALSRASSPEADGVVDVIDPNDLLGAPRRAQCGKLQPAVLIDLDPELSVFRPAAPLAQPGLAEALAALRAAGITVMWSSALQVEQAEKVSAALSRAGLDPNRIDRLLLLKGPGDRKQARRLSAARNWCVVAMAGDRRGDFDEAFDYLKDPETQIPADRLFGNGWFIAPAPLP
ncbi:MAG: hypothetical protein ACKOPO_04750 [Novosphingobium sp.]